LGLNWEGFLFLIYSGEDINHKFFQNFIFRFLQ